MSPCSRGPIIRIPRLPGLHFPACSTLVTPPGLVWYSWQTLQSIILNHVEHMPAWVEATYVQLQTLKMAIFPSEGSLKKELRSEGRKEEHTVWEVKCHGHWGGLSGAAGCDLLQRKWNSCPPSVLLKCHAECGSSQQGGLMEMATNHLPLGLCLKSHVYAAVK